MNDQPKSETLGAWIVHHGLKVSADQAGASEFPAIDAAAKTGMLLAGLSASDQFELSHAEVTAIAKAARLNPKTELCFALEELKKRHLIDVALDAGIHFKLDIKENKVG